MSTAERLVSTVDDLVSQTFSENDMAVGARVLTAPDVDDAVEIADGYRITVTLIVSAVDVNVVNPFPASPATVQSLIALANSPEVQMRVASTSRELDTEIVNQVREAPMIAISVTAPAPDQAVEGYAYVYEQVADSLSRLQDANNVPPANQTALQAIVQPTVPYMTPASVVRPAAGVVLLGVGLADHALASLPSTFAKASVRPVRGGGVTASRWYGGRVG